MKLKKLLSKYKEEIIRQWICTVNGTYPFATSGFMRTQEDPFINPVGQGTRQAAETLISAILQPDSSIEINTNQHNNDLSDNTPPPKHDDMSFGGSWKQAARQNPDEALVKMLTSPLSEAVQGALDEFMRVRAIQSFPAETAVGIIFSLKYIIRGLLADHPEMSNEPSDLLGELLALESDIDSLALMAFGAYTRHREKVSELRIEEFRRSHSQIIRLAQKAVARNLVAPGQEKTEQ